MKWTMYVVLYIIMLHLGIFDQLNAAFVETDESEITCGIHFLKSE